MDTLDTSKAHAGMAMEHPRQLTRAGFSPCGKFVAAGGLDREVHCWELETKAHTARGGHASWIGALAFHPREPRLYSGDYHGGIRAWDFAQPEAPPLFTIENTHPGAVRALALLGVEPLLISAGDGPVVRAWNPQDGKALRDFPGHFESVFALATHGDTLATGDLRGAIRLWKPDGTLVRTLDASALHTRKEDFIADVGGVRSLAFNADGTRLAAGGISSAESNTFCPGTPTVLVFDAASGAVVATLKMKGKGDGYINGLRWLPDGALAIAGEHLNAPTQMTFWRPEKEEAPFHTVTGESAYDLDLHPDGLRLVAPHFVSKGSGGNGARSKHREEYKWNAAQVRVVNLFAKAAGKKGEK
jgi:WD40 repeat protein